MRIFYFSLFIFLVEFSSAQVAFSVEVLNDSMQIGDVNFYRFKLTHPENITIRSTYDYTILSRYIIYQ
jgi:hypothetical protein